MFELIITRYRGVIVTIFLLPMSVLLRWFIFFRDRSIRMFFSNPRSHQKRVQRVQQQLKDWRDGGAGQKLCTNRSPWKSMSELVPNYKKKYRGIDVSMYSILEVDEDRKVVKVEPMVDMGQITRALTPKGWTLAILPELDALTVGGLIMGFGVESSSHRFGLFQHICVSFDIVTPDGELRHCSKTENTDLFYSIPWSHGTLGFLVAAELRIIPAKKYVKLHYQPTNSLGELVDRFEKASRDRGEALFVEALTYAPDKAVLMTGDLVDDVPAGATVNRIGRWYKPWFYTHVETFLHKGAGIEYIPLRQYYHRHTRSYFWEMRDIIPFGNKPWFRWLLGWAMPPHIQLLKRLQTKKIQKLRVSRHIVQDMIVPVRDLAKSMEYFEDNYALHPLWLCPLSIRHNPDDRGFIHPVKRADGTYDGLFVDIGAYGTPTVPGFDGNEALQKLEQFVIDHDGFQALYARTLMSAEQFEQMFDHGQYRQLRDELPLVKKAFDDVYTKVAKGRTSPVQLKSGDTQTESVPTKQESSVEQEI